MDPTDADREAVHHLSHLGALLKKNGNQFPGIAEWNRAVASEHGETYAQLIKRLRDK